jgi:hypothetical protein
VARITAEKIRVMNTLLMLSAVTDLLFTPLTTAASDIGDFPKDHRALCPRS